VALGGASAGIVVDYPEDGSIFPPEMTAPTFLFRDRGGPWIGGYESIDSVSARREFESQCRIILVEQPIS